MTSSYVAMQCPEWCLHTGHSDIEPGDPLMGEHVHVSADVGAGEPDQPLMARLIGRSGDETPRVLLNGRVATVDQVDAFVAGVRQLLDRARLAAPGLGLVADLWTAGMATFTEVSAMSGIEEDRIREQSRGGQVLTVHELDRLALTLAQLVSAATTPAA